MTNLITLIIGFMKIVIMIVLIIIPTYVLAEWIDPNDLEIGKTYIISKKTPVVFYPNPWNPDDPWAAMKSMRYFPKGSVFKVIDQHDKDVGLWYLAEFFYNKHKVTGWINRNALYGVQLKAKDAE